MPRNLAFQLMFGAIAVLAFAAAHLVWPLSLPPPWIDEVHFLIPASSFADNGSFSSSQMIVPNIYWIPAGFYLINGLVFLLMGHVDLDLARTVSFAAITGAAWILRGLLSVALGPANQRWPLLGDALTIAWYISLPVVFAGNIARPDAMIVLVSVASVICILRGRIVGGFGLAMLALLLHPLLGIPACAVVAASVPAFRKTALPNLREGWWEWLILATAAGLLAFETLRIISDFAEYRRHWEFQLSRKMGREIGWIVIPFATLTASAFIMDLFCHWRAARQSTDKLPQRMQILVFSLFCILVQIYGQEMWYFPFSLLGLVLIAAAFLGGLRTDRRNTAMLLGSAILPLTIIAAAWSTWGIGLRPRGVFGFQTWPLALTEVSTDRRYVLGIIRNRLREDNSGSDLIDPVFADLILDSRNSDDQALLTWVPFSRKVSQKFGHVVVVERGYPAFHTDTPDSLLADHVCRLDETVVSPKRYYQVRIITLAANATEGRPYVECNSF